jgi:hypothetical protein
MTAAETVADISAVAAPYLRATGRAKTIVDETQDHLLTIRTDNP